MKCLSCKSDMVQSFATDVFYTGDVLARLEQLRKKAEEVLTELTVIDFDKVA